MIARKKYVLFLLIILLSHKYLISAQLNQVNSIGDDRENYTFFIPVGAVLSDNKDIFVLDGQGLFVSKFGWDGKFLKKTGQRGQGPKDFYFPRCLDIYNNKLYVLDAGNSRICQSDLELEHFNYYKFSEQARFFSLSFTLPNSTFVGPFKQVTEGRGRIGIIDKEGNVIRHFFNEYPIDLDINKKKLTLSGRTEFEMRRVLISEATKPVIAVNRQRQLMMVSYSYPGNPIMFYIYNTRGKLLKKFSHAIDSKYQFFDLLIKTKTLSNIRNPANYPKKYYRPYIFGLHFYRGHYLAQLWLEDYKRKKELVKRTMLLLIFNPEGTLKDEIPLEDGLRFFSISKDGYVLASKLDEEITKLYIYKLKI